MPKILPDIQNKILTVAEQHFNNFGFENSDMREIAAQSDVAVGTVYLHFHNKEELFQQVVISRWSKLLEKFSTIAQKTDAPDALIKEIILLLVEEMTNRKSPDTLWMEIGSFHHHQFFKEVPINHFSGMRDPITGILSGLIQSMAAQKGRTLDESTCSQLGSFTFIMAVDICMQAPEQAVHQINLIPELLTAYINQ